MLLQRQNCRLHIGRFNTENSHLDLQLTIQEFQWSLNDMLHVLQLQEQNCVECEETSDE